MEDLNGGPIPQQIPPSRPTGIIDRITRYSKGVLDTIIQWITGFISGGRYINAPDDPIK